MIRFRRACVRSVLQVRCKDRKLCAAAGARVVVTDRARTNRTDLVLSGPAFAAMARPGMAARLAKLRTVDVEYKRWVKCQSTCVFSFTNRAMRLILSSSARRTKETAAGRLL